MIKNTELRLGNLFIDAKSKSIVEVFEIGERVVFTVVDRSKFPLPNGWKAEPIPLDPIWFKRLGFRSRHNLTQFYLISSKGVEHEICFEFDLVDGELFGSFWIGINSPNKLLINVCNVHQMQNLYWSITGEELPIVK